MATHCPAKIIEEVSADKAYSSRENLNIVDELGGEAYVPFTENAKVLARQMTLINDLGDQPFRRQSVSTSLGQYVTTPRRLYGDNSDEQRILRTADSFDKK